MRAIDWSKSLELSRRGRLIHAHSPSFLPNGMGCSRDIHEVPGRNGPYILIREGFTTRPSRAAIMTKEEAQERFPSEFKTEGRA